MSDIQALQKRAVEIRRMYAQANSKDGHDTWGPKEYTMGFVGDLGDLIKIVMTKENLRSSKNADDVDGKLAHELADCLWSVLVLSEHYGIELEKEFLQTMDGLEKRIVKAAKASA